MKLIIIAIILSCFHPLIAQDQLREDDFGKITLNVFISENSGLSSDAKSLLTTKLKQIATNTSSGGTSINPRFVLTANVALGSKDIIPGPPQLIAQNVEAVLFIGDAKDNKLFSTTTLTLKGVGNNENKSFLDAIHKINPNKVEINEFVEKGKKKIIDFYNEQCEAILSESIVLGQQEKYDNAIYKLSLVPIDCKDCYSKCIEKIALLYQAKINQEGKVKLSEAIAAWNYSQDINAAKNAFHILSEIKVDASCQPEVNDLMARISEKLDTDALKEWDFQVKQYNDSVAREVKMLQMQEDQNIRDSELDKLQISLYRAVAIEYARNQPKTINYSNINWK